MTRGPSAHLTWSELACHDGTPYPSAFRADGRARELAHVFETIRAACGGKPLTVLSAYRTPSHNRKVGGARNSQHLHGRAIDLRTPKGFTVARFADWIKTLATTTHPQIRGLGIYTWGCHVDIRPSDRLVVWNGGAAVKESRSSGA